MDFLPLGLKLAGHIVVVVGGGDTALPGALQLEWFIALWSLLERGGVGGARLELSELDGWPLLPTRRGQVYAPPAGGAHNGSRMLDLSALPPSAPLSEALQDAGCLVLHARVDARARLERYGLAVPVGLRVAAHRERRRAHSAPACRSAGGRPPRGEGVTRRIRLETQVSLFADR